MSHNTALSAHAAPVMLTTEEAASLIGVTRRFLEKDRHTARQNGTSPAIPYSEMGRRTVRYNRADVLAFLDATRVE
ncbi:hypothetical protein [Marivita sp.]|uniref:hypothetical protein n=1 Tax=Marivita sp. TaxID=2003365 RepID=UPI0025C64430|nr:hypothetical protein [Marivita sp.]